VRIHCGGDEEQNGEGRRGFRWWRESEGDREYPASQPAIKSFLSVRGKCGGGDASSRSNAQKIETWKEHGIPDLREATRIREWKWERVGSKGERRSGKSRIYQ